MAPRWQRSRLMHFAPLALAWLSRHTAAVIFVNLSLGLLGVPALTEALLVTAGAVAAHGSGSAWTAFAAAVAGSAVGMTISFHVGRAAQPLFERWAPSMSSRPHPRRAARAHDWWRRLGPWSVVLAYFAPGLRHATAIVAGSTNMERKRFVALAVCGACAWSSLLVWGGGHVSARAAAAWRVVPIDYRWKRPTRTALPSTCPSIALTTAVRVAAASCGVPCGTSSFVSSA